MTIKEKEEKERTDYVARALEIGTTICFGALIFVVALQVFARFALPQSPSWTEEVSRFLFIYAVAFAAPLAIKQNEYVRVDLLINLLNKTLRLILEILTYVILTIFFAILAYYGAVYSQFGIGQTSPALGLSMFIPYVSVSILSFFIVIYCILKIIEYVKAKEVKLDHLYEEEV